MLQWFLCYYGIVELMKIGGRSAVMSDGTFFLFPLSFSVFS